MPPFLNDTGRGWVTAEYSMLPSSTGGGRYVELQGTAEHKPFTEESLDAWREGAKFETFQAEVFNHMIVPR